MSIPGGNLTPGGSGRSAACGPCNGRSGQCACLIYCGHEMCSGSPPPGMAEPIATKSPTKPGNPKGLGGPTRKSPAAEKRAPKYDGPRGKGKRWGRGRPA